MTNLNNGNIIQVSILIFLNKLLKTNLSISYGNMDYNNNHWHDHTGVSLLGQRAVGQIA